MNYKDIDLEGKLPGGVIFSGKFKNFFLFTIISTKIIDFYLNFYYILCRD
jgi:hypothetical protein